MDKLRKFKNIFRFISRSKDSATHPSPDTNLAHDQNLDENSAKNVKKQKTRKSRRSETNSPFETKNIELVSEERQQTKDPQHVRQRAKTHVTHKNFERVVDIQELAKNYNFNEDAEEEQRVNPSFP